MKRLAAITILALGIAGCARTPPPSPATPAPGALETIVYETGPCFGSCPVFRIKVFSNNSGIFTGIRHTNVIGDANFPITPVQFAAFKAILAPYRPKGEKRISHGSPECPNAPTDMPSVQVVWGEAKGSDSLYFYYGCGRGDENHKMADALGGAPDLLPLDMLIGERP